MHSNLQGHPKKLLVVSDTAMQYAPDGVKAFGPVAKELIHLLEEFDEITWIGFEKKQKNNSLVLINNEKIHPILLENVGGQRLKDKLNILASYPKMFRVILKEVKKHQFIHSRAPSNPSVIVMFLSLFFTKKQFWHKYAGSWIDSASFFYELQRLFLKKLRKNSKITINGDYGLSNKNIISFENPCLDGLDRVNGKAIVAVKTIPTLYNFCFVGGLTRNKGVDKILEALTQIKPKQIGEFHFVGDGPERKTFETMAEITEIKTIFHGFLAKDDICNIYKKCHFIVLPSKSEGFPKVIGEAMNYGCVSVVSDVSCISQYVKHEENGFLINPIISVSLLDQLLKAISLSHYSFQKMIEENYKLSKKFTYDYYNNRIVNEVFEIQKHKNINND